MITSKQILLGVSLFLTNIHLHAADNPKSKTEVDLSQILNTCDNEHKECTAPIEQQQIKEFAQDIVQEKLSANMLSNNELWYLIECFNRKMTEPNDIELYTQAKNKLLNEI